MVSPLIRDLIEEIELKYANEVLTRELDEVEEALMQKLDLLRPRRGRRAAAAAPAARPASGRTRSGSSA